jgi:hypothetical protein
MGQGFMSEQATWMHQLEFIRQGNHVYMDQLMPAGVDFDHKDAFLPLESISLPAASCSQYARRPWSEEATEAKLVFSWGSSDRRAWQILESLQSRYGPGQKGKAPPSPADGKPSGHSKNEKGGPPACFQVGNIRQLISELLQVDIAQVHVFFDAYRLKRPPSDEGGSQRSRQSDKGNGAEISPPSQSDAFLELRPSSNSLDRRTPEQLMHVLERAVMDAIKGPKLPLPLSQLVSLTVTKLPRSPFRQQDTTQGTTGWSRVASSGHGRHGGATAEQLLIELPWLKLQPPKLMVTLPESSPRISQRSDSPQHAHNPPVLDTPWDVETSSTRDNTSYHKTPYHKDNTSDNTSYHKTSYHHTAYEETAYHSTSRVSHMLEIEMEGNALVRDASSHASNWGGTMRQDMGGRLQGNEDVPVPGLRLHALQPQWMLPAPEAQAYRSDLSESYLSQVSSETDAEERLQRQRLQLQQHHLTLHRDCPQEDYHTRPLRSHSLHLAGADQVLVRYLCWQVLQMSDKYPTVTRRPWSCHPSYHPRLYTYLYTCLWACLVAHVGKKACARA